MANNRRGHKVVKPSVHVERSQVPLTQKGTSKQLPQLVKQGQGGASIEEVTMTNTTDITYCAPHSPSNPFVLRNIDKGAGNCPNFGAHSQIPLTDSNGKESAPPPSASPLTPSPTQQHHRSPRSGPHNTTPLQRLTLAHRHRVHAKRAAVDINPFFEEHRNGVRCCKFCKHMQSADLTYHVSEFSSTSSTSTLCAHLFTHHLASWVDACDKFKISITAAQAQHRAAEYRLSKGETPKTTLKSDERLNIPEYSSETFLDAITEFIIVGDHAINVIESPQLRKIFLLLRSELKDSDIPHRSTIRRRVGEVWSDYFRDLEHEMKGSLGSISMTTDLWSDSNLSPFMAVTAHWIETKEVSTLDGPQLELKLRSDLIGFHRVPGHHDGEHLAQSFLYIIDRLSLAKKLGWITLDNASNNDTLMQTLEYNLRYCGIFFDCIKNRIRCFPHIVNLACKAVVDAFANIDIEQHIVKSKPPTNEPGSPATTGSLGDALVKLRSLVRIIRALSLRRQQFSAAVRSVLKGRDLQLLRDVETCWCATLYMISRGLDVKEAIDLFFQHSDFAELQKHNLSNGEWDGLHYAEQILSVPDAFLQKLSAEKTPTLCYAIPLFQSLITMWKEQQEEAWCSAELAEVIQAGIDKLEVYQLRLTRVPAYTIAMILNPNHKLQPIPAEEHDRAKALLHATLFPYNQKRMGASSQSLANDSQPPLDLGSGHTPSNYSPACTQISGRSYQKRMSHSLDQILGLTHQAPLQQGSLDAEIASYLADTKRSTNPIIYWQENQLAFPTFFLAALDYLPIQGSAVPCERVFSSAKETMVDRRNQISPELMEMLQMLKYSFRSGKSLDFGVGSAEEFIQYLEDVEIALDNHPEDISMYIQKLQTKSSSTI